MINEKSHAKPRIKDIAQAAGVSIATVSNVLNQRKQMNSESGQRVLRIAREMGYELAAPRTASHRCIRFVIHKKHGRVVMDTPFFSELMSGIEQQCHRCKYELIISYVDSALGSEAQERIRSIVSDAAVPILLLATEMDLDDIAPYRALRVPVLVLDSLFHCEPFNTVVINNFEAGMLATRHLIDMGHSRIGFIGSSLPFNNMRDRFSGYLAALTEAGLSAEPGLALYVEPTLDGARRDMAALLARRTAPLPSAFFAANDLIAVGVTRALKDHGLHIPDDVSIIGMDDMPICEVVTPKLSTIAVPKSEIGAAAVSRLIQMAEHTDSLTLKTEVSVSLMPRQSVRMIVQR